ncbi:hypothetical protein [uncultured Alistipes sp.]|uniref:hypothetical protein n=1 Tax=uncultured Alistipes sp. TaxID=538949 RepID=UPI0026399E3D|nr:hypothetical protein [uncultured Alistipes sp.]
MDKKIIIIFMLLCCIFIISCSNEDEESSLSVIGTWNASFLTEDAVYTDLEKEKHNNVEINYGTYIWKFEENGNIKVAGSVDGNYQWYNKGEKPTDYQTFVFDKNQMKLLMEFLDTSKSPAVYDVLNLSDTEMTLRGSATWLNVGEGEVIITRTLTFNKIN